MDIVERLRRDADGWTIPTNTVAATNTVNLEREAADEIERLRAENERLRKIAEALSAVAREKDLEVERLRAAADQYMGNEA